MRNALMDFGWFIDGLAELTRDAQPDAKLIGLALGYDFCAEHEARAKWTDAFGVKPPTYPMGAEDRLMTQVPERLQFVRYDHRARDRRRKRAIPAAALKYDTWGDLLTPENAAQVLAHDAPFWTDVQEKYHRPDKDDMVISWAAHDGFVIHVRGEHNVALLAELHEAMLAKKVAIASGSSMGFLRTPMSFIIVECMSEEQKARVLARDQDHKALTEAALATGIEARLKAAGRGWYALSPAWSEGPGSPVRFFLNPQNQREHLHGWFSVEDLDAWIRGEGPVMGKGTHDAFKDVIVDAAIRLDEALQRQHEGWFVKQHDYLPTRSPDDIAVRVHLSNPQGERRTVELTFDEARALALSVEPHSA